MRAILALIFSLCLCAAADASPRHHHVHHHRHHHARIATTETASAASWCWTWSAAPWCSQQLAPIGGNAFRHGGHQVAGDPRPAHAWCGWYMRHLLGVADRSYNLARNWVHYGSPAGGPMVGAIVVWRHHVGRIVGRGGNGEWIVTSGNDGNQVRTRAMSLAGAIAFRY
jgi:hypothetical protein